MSIEAPPTPHSWTIDRGLETGPLPVTAYTSKEYYEREIDRIWNRTWILIGKTHQIPRAGDYFVKALPWAKTAVMVVRGKDGRVRAFHNICSHRCNRLLWDDCGSSQLFRCTYHGWVYGLDGTLLKVTDEPNFFGLDKAEHGLTAVNVDTWKGLIFVNLA